MTVVNRNRRGSSRRPADSDGTVDRATRAVWTIAWCVGVPVLVVGNLVNHQVGNAWGVLPGDLHTAPTLAMLVAFVVCAVQRHHRVEIWLGVIPALAALAGHVGFDNGLAGLGVGVPVGGLWCWILRRRQGR
jgi:hypothetical protein